MTKHCWNLQNKYCNLVNCLKLMSETLNLVIGFTGSKTRDTVENLKCFLSKCVSDTGSFYVITHML